MAIVINEIYKPSHGWTQSNKHINSSWNHLYVWWIVTHDSCQVFWFNYWIKFQAINDKLG
jgi:hypothetical protein